MMLNGAALNVNKCVTSRKTAFPKDRWRYKTKNCGYPFINLLVIQKYVYSFLYFPQNGISSKLTENSPKIFILFFQISLISREILSYVSLKFADNLAKNQF